MMIHKAKKSLGQNFLKSESALVKIVAAGEIKPNDIILEIGPGKGALTEKLLEKAGTVIAVEKDRELLEFLKTKFEKEIKEEKLKLIDGDILEFNISQAVLSFAHGLAGEGTQKTEDLRKIPKLLGYKIIANIPYNITGAILKKFLTAKVQPEVMVLMVQHEVATRILARDYKESILSVSVKAYGEPKLITKVDKRYFSPAPKVNSAVIKIIQISRRLFVENNLSEEKFWQVVKTGFAHKRKKLSGNLKDICPKDILTPYADKRAEDLTLSDWVQLAR